MLKLAFKFSAVGPYENAVSVLLVIFVLASVLSSVSPSKVTFTVKPFVDKVAHENAIPVTFSVFEFSFVCSIVSFNFVNFMFFISSISGILIANILFIWRSAILFDFLQLLFQI